MKRDFKNPVIAVDEKLPRPGRWVFVITDSFRCMGYVDEKGTWREVHRKEVIEGVRAWSPASEDETVMWNRKS